MMESEFPAGMRPRRPGMRAQQRDQLLRIAAAYRDTFILPNGEQTPHGQTVLRDLARFTQMFTGTIPQTPTEATVLAAQHAVYAHIMQMLNTTADDIPLIEDKDE